MRKEILKENKVLKVVLTVVIILSTVLTAVLSINLAQTNKNYKALFNLYTLECEKVREEEAPYLSEDFHYEITCEEATQYEIQDLINCSEAKGDYCTLEDYR